MVFITKPFTNSLTTNICDCTHTQNLGLRGKEVTSTLLVADHNEVGLELTVLSADSVASGDIGGF